MSAEGSAEREEEGLDDSVLSDVHLGVSFSQVPNSKTLFTSRYPIHLALKDDKEDLMEGEDIKYDSDGDVVFPSRRDFADEVISISHRLSTPLRLVGFQCRFGEVDCF
eukprot:TRINITY_DN11987_c0_g1_i1.p1 TRINITY_DN11987_c0_g1~~TRINITY_DN11987_c0_g1_i1.p1  ORF type:complete len:108 (-),score=25.60 TRINITY_DN11987_c0_g1_i1:241-564(-)